MKDIASASTGHLSLAASNTIGTYVLPRMISKFCNSNPGIKVSVFVGNTAQVSQGIAEQRYSLGFIEGPLHVRGLTAIRFGDDILLPVVAAGHRLANVPDVVPSDLDDEPLLMRELGSGTRELITDILHGLKIVEGPVMEFGNTEAIKQAVIHDAGIAWLPALSIRTELENGALVPLASDQLTIRRSLNVIRRDSSPGSPANDAFIRLLIQ
jgi:DNA-binding transcriptional LysR family regulator